MHSLTSTLRVAAGLAIASLAASPLASCSGSSPALPQPPVTSTPARANAPADATSAQAQPEAHKKKQQLLFVSDNENNEIRVFNAATNTQNPPPLRTITTGIDGPNGIATDERGNLYVANYVSNTVTVYAPNASAPKTTISNGLSGPYDVKVDAFGNIYVANDPLYGGIAYIVLYPAGSSSPSTKWNAPTTGTTISGIALLNPTMQGQTSIYALGYTLNGSGFASGFALACYVGGSGPVCSNIGETFGQTGGITVSQSPSSKPFQWLAVDQYVPGVDIFTQNQPMTQLVTGGTPEFITMNKAGNELFVADRFYGRVTKYNFPSGKALNTYAGGAQVYGVATSPSGDYH